MWSEDEKVCVVFNGEIYNAEVLREELVAAGHAFRTDHSDTEVLVHGYEEWGEQLPCHLDGMFAFLIWDRRRRDFFLARDRFGEKPLYVGRTGRGWIVASEIKSLLAFPGLRRALDIDGLAEYLSFDFAVAPRTLLADVSKIGPATAGFISAEAGLRTWRYWVANPIEVPRDEPDQLVELDRLLNEAVRTRLVSDVPVGLFLSGGLDSSTVGFYMCRHAKRVVSFSIGFEEASYDETAYARLAAERLGIEHHVEKLSQQRVLDLLPSIVDILDEPLADQSVLPTYLLSLFTRRHVKVALGGDGSDEIFMGYKAYLLMKAAWLTPRPIAAVASSFARLMPAEAAVKVKGAALVRDLRLSPRQRLLSHLGAFKGDGRFVLAPGLRRRVGDPLSNVLPSLQAGVPDGAAAHDETARAYLETYLANDILAKVDRASMAASLEVRAPFLHPGLASFGLSLPAKQRLRGMEGKYLLRRLMDGRLPAELVSRQKMGFGIPIDAWFRGDLAALARDALDPVRVRERGIFDETVVSRLLAEHSSGRRNHGRRLWSLVQLELWLQRWIDSPSSSVSAYDSAA